MYTNIWDNESALIRLEKQRDARRRAKKRLSFDCYNLKFKGDRAYCSKGKRLGRARDGSMKLITVLQGITARACIGCKYYTADK